MQAKRQATAWASSFLHQTKSVKLKKIHTTDMFKKLRKKNIQQRMNNICVDRIQLFT